MIEEISTKMKSMRYKKKGTEGKDFVIYKSELGKCFENEGKIETRMRLSL